jgi:4-amino-4-deoxy-L-arabinose transferase-like glycosyltransferase
MKHKNKILPYIFILALIFLFSFLFFYRLDYNTLVSWDEAWYASIARDILKSGNWIDTSFNGKPFYDHPPLGFWLMALSYKIFGINEFSARFPSAFLGLLTIILVFFIFRKLFKNDYIAFVSSLILGTSVWYILRVRSGNLDSILLFFYALTVYFSLKAKDNFFWFILTGIAFGFLVLSKTLVGISAIFLIFLINFQNFLKLFSSKKNFLNNFLIILVSFILFFLIVSPWYKFHLEKYPEFFYHHFFDIGTRRKTLQDFLKLNYQLPLFYLHMGVRKWYYLWWVSFIYFFISLKFLKKEIFFLLFWNIVVLYPFLTTDLTHIWHLLPVYLPLSMIIAGGFYYLGRSMYRWFQKKFRKINLFKKYFLKIDFFNFIYLFCFLILTVIQIKNFYKEIIPQSKYLPDEVEISKRLTKYKEKIFLDDDFLPIAVFYSQKQVTPLYTLPDELGTMVKLFKSKENNFVIVTRNWAVANLDKEGIKYIFLEKNKSYSILKKE